MSWIKQTASLWRRWRHSGEAEADLDGEVRSYFETVAQRFEAQGLTPDEARRAARLNFEDPERVKQKVREARTGASAETVWHDLRYAWRVLLKSPGFTIVAVLTLALGIGANTAVFSLINAVMLRILPAERPEQLVLLTDPESAGVAVDTMETEVRHKLSYPEFLDLRSENRVFSGLLAAQSDANEMDVTPAGRGENRWKAREQLVSGDFFEVLGVQPVLGRVFTPAEDQAPGANPVAVISYDLWQRQFGGSTSVIGQRLQAGTAVFTILGVAPPGFRGISVGAPADIWFPLTMQQQVLPGRNYLTPRDTLWLQVMGRLSPGMSVKTAQAGINVTFQQSLQAWASTLTNARLRQQVPQAKLVLQRGDRGASSLRGAFADPLKILMAMVGLVLLIACANIANLMLSRANGRQREIGVRLALGAARARLIRQLLTESLLVAALGGLLGILLAGAGSRLLVSMVLMGDGTAGLDVPWDMRVLLFTAAATLVTAVLFGLAPAIRATQVDVAQTLGGTARGAAGSHGRARTGRILAVAQVALSLVLLVGAAWFVRSLNFLLSVNLGFDRGHLLSVRVDPPAAGYKGAARSELYDKVRLALQSLPGVRSVTVAGHGLFNGDSGDEISLEGSSVHGPDRLDAQWTEIGPDYFSTLGIPMLRGREIDAADSTRGMQVCVVNEAFARKYYPNSDPIGKHVTDEYPTTRETFEIIGVAANAREHRPNERIYPRFYANLTHPIGFLGAVTFLIRSTGDPAALGAAVTRTLLQVDRNLPILRMRTADEEIGRQLLSQRVVAELAAFFGLVALFMAAIGLYGVLSYSTARRAGEIGVRMALGASGGDVQRMVLGETLRMVALGLAIGLPCALAAGRLIRTALYGLTTADPWSMAAAGAVLLGAAALAGYVPARRAAKMDPMVSLRAD